MFAFSSCVGKVSLHTYIYIYIYIYIFKLDFICSCIKKLISTFMTNWIIILVILLPSTALYSNPPPLGNNTWAEEDYQNFLYHSSLPLALTIQSHTEQYSVWYAMLKTPVNNPIVSMFSKRYLSFPEKCSEIFKLYVVYSSTTSYVSSSSIEIVWTMDLASGIPYTGKI